MRSSCSSGMQQLQAETSASVPHSHVWRIRSKLLHIFLRSSISGTVKSGTALFYMSDLHGINLCWSLFCLLQESLNNKKANTQVNTVTSTSSNTSTAKTAAPKPASSESSSSAKTSAPSGQAQSVTKIPCSQCLNAFFHKPELMEFKVLLVHFIMLI